MLATLAKRVDRVEAKTGRRATANNLLLAELRQDPARILSAAGLMPDPWQQNLLRSYSSRVLMLCSRQAGKSTTAAALALRTALLTSRALVLLLSASWRQSAELFEAHVRRLHRALGCPVAISRESALRMELANGSRVISLPGTEETIRGFSGVSLLVVDEAARVPDALYYSVRPMLAVSGGKLVCLTTPFGRRGWFHDAWHSTEHWERVRITAEQCPRIAAAFLEEERQALGERWFRQEYLCSFEDLVDAVFRSEDIMAARADDILPFFAGDDKP